MLRHLRQLEEEREKLIRESPSISGRVRRSVENEFADHPAVAAAAPCHWETRGPPFIGGPLEREAAA